DGVMRKIVGNHVALVEKGRAGSDVMVGDEAPDTSTQETDMADIKLTRTGRAVHGLLTAFLLPMMAKDAQINLMPVVKDLDIKNFRGEAARKKVVRLALDAAIPGMAPEHKAA